MKIVQISSLWESTPPPKYGGLELVVSNLTEELVRRGHEVTLFATGDSKTKAKLVSVYPRALYRDDVPWTSMYDTLTHISEAVKYAREWGADVIHNHLSHRSLSTMALSEVPFINTVHGVLDEKIIPADVKRAFTHYRSQNYVSISNYQQRHAQYLHWAKTVYNGINVQLFPFESSPRADYLLWIGRFTKTKAPHLAIKIAQQAGLPLKMAAKLDQHVPADIEYFNTEIKPLLNDQIKWVGEVGHKEKAELYKNALVFLNPIQWDEPFGLTVAESMACGTPVIAYNRGSMSELITDGETGFLIEPNDERRFLEAIKQIPLIDRAKCRDRVERLFSVSAMAEGYLDVYSQVLAK